MFPLLYYMIIKALIFHIPRFVCMDGVSHFSNDISLGVSSSCSSTHVSKCKLSTYVKLYVIGNIKRVPFLMLSYDST